MRSDDWTETILPERRWFDLRLGEVLRYRDLLTLLVRRDIVATYAQTILGPFWIVLQPLATTLILAAVFGNLAGLSTDGQPTLPFYLAGVILWGYFSAVLVRTGATFVEHAPLFGKVWFPRLIVPLASVGAALVRLVVQLALFAAVLVAFAPDDAGTSPLLALALLAPLLAILSSLALGLGLLVSALTARYRDLQIVLQFGVQLLMYATPVIYPLSAMPEHLRVWLALNPLAPVIETFRAVTLGGTPIPSAALVQGAAVSLVCLALGVLAFVRAESRFMDTV